MRNNTLKETILNYSGILVEDLNAKQAGDLIINLKNKHYNEDEIIKSLNSMVEKYWIHLNKNDKYKTIFLSIIPKDWSGGNGISIEDSIVGNHNNDANFIRNIIKKWTENLLKKTKEENKGYNVTLHDRKNDKDITITA